MNHQSDRATAVVKNSIFNFQTFKFQIFNFKASIFKFSIFKLTIDNNDIKFTKSVKLLSITVDDRLWFYQHMSNLCSKAVMQLNALARLKKYMGKSEESTIPNSFIYADFNYCPFVWHFSTCELIRKIDKIKKRFLKIVLDDYESDYDILLKKWKSDDGNKAIKSSGIWNF